MVPKLSIITINRNNADGLRKTIQSVLMQTSIEFEYIVIDGASTDESVAVIKSFSEIPPNQQSNQPINYWKSEPDSGIYNAMNKGIKMANGKYLQFLNSGDVLLSANVTERMLLNLTDAAIIYGNKLKILPNGKRVYDKIIDANSLNTYYRGTLNHATAYIKKELFSKYGLYDESLEIVSDWKFYLIAIGLNGEFVKHKDIDMVNFDMTGISVRDKELVNRERKEVLKELIPASILSDYQNWSSQIIQLQRINRFSWAKNTLWFIERLLFKFEKHFRSKE
ncbi:MAG: glycosyltransferase involved in cell wall biosynthesis [Paraglaciecola sp.]|jgi:glycosyltransferase involved in cell wall biosynthesis|uniref:glycosyltransferase family 2 protein n=1 Tax=Polaribacter sp. TaxID=1920175 RepID=UPI003EEE39C3